jgi:phosphatidylglycerophosphate synthase
MTERTVHMMWMLFVVGTVGYLVVAHGLFVRGLRRSVSPRSGPFGSGPLRSLLHAVGPANAVTLVRSTLVGVVTGFACASFVGQVPPGLVVAVAVPALALDAVDGWVARRTRSSNELGARFDMEVDAFLLLVLGVVVAPALGVWVLAIGLMRYAFVAASWVLPWMDQRLPFRYWRKVVTAAQGIALTLAVLPIPHALAIVLVAVALALLVESFGRDVVWLARHREPVLSAYARR